MITIRDNFEVKTYLIIAMAYLCVEMQACTEMIGGDADGCHCHREKQHLCYEFS